MVVKSFVQSRAKPWSKIPCFMEYKCPPIPIAIYLIIVVLITANFDPFNRTAKVFVCTYLPVIYLPSNLELTTHEGINNEKRQHQ